MSAYTTVIFDLGGVVVGSPLKGISAFEESNGIPKGFVNVAIANSGWSGAFQRLERGEISLKEMYGALEEEMSNPSNIIVYKEYLKRKGIPIPDNICLSYKINVKDMFEMMMAETSKINSEMIHALFVLRHLGFRVCALTNNWKLDFMGNVEDSSSAMKLGFLFDEIFQSSELGMRKPDPRIYELVCEKLSARPDEIVFLDDIGINLKSASSVGWKTVKVEIDKAPNALRQLANILRIPPEYIRPASSFSCISLRRRYEENRIFHMNCYGLASNSLVVFLSIEALDAKFSERVGIKFAKAGFCCLVIHVDDNSIRRWHWADYCRQLRSFLIDTLRLPRHPFGCALIADCISGLAALKYSAIKEVAKAVTLLEYPYNTCSPCIEENTDELISTVFDGSFRNTTPLLLIRGSEKIDVESVASKILRNKPYLQTSQIWGKINFQDDGIRNRLGTEMLSFVNGHLQSMAKL